MATKYISHGNTYDGDGTSSDAATVDGGVGAWNSFTSIFVGTVAYGSLAAGDTINVRTHDGSGNIDINISGNLVSNTISTYSNPISWVFDDGSIWPDSGVLSIIQTTSGIIKFQGFNRFFGKSKNFSVKSTYTGSLNNFILLENAELSEVFFETADRSTDGYQSITQGSNCISILNDCHFYIGTTYSDSRYTPFIYGSYGVTQLINNMKITFGPDNNQTADKELFGRARDANIVMRNLEIVGDWEGLSFIDPISGEGALNCSVTKIKTDGLINFGHVNYSSFSAPDTKNLSISDINGKPFDYHFCDYSGSQEFQSNGNYPTFSAMLPDGSSTPWSVKIFPYNASDFKPIICSTINKIYNAANSNNTLTFELLLHEDFTSPQKDQWWADVWYTGSDDAMYHLSSKVSGALATSTANWSSTTYGAENYVRYKIELTTAVAVKQHTIINAVLYSNVPSVTTNQFYFIDPDFQIASV